MNIFSANDKLVKALKDKGYNLIKFPRTDIKPLQVLVKSHSGIMNFKNWFKPTEVKYQGAISDILKSGKPTPKAKSGRVAQVLKEASSSVLKAETSLALTLQLLNNSKLSTQQKADLTALFANLQDTNFSFGEKTKLSEVKTTTLDSYLRKAQPKDDVGLAFEELLTKEKTSIYIITSVLQSDTFSFVGTNYTQAQLNGMIEGIKKILDADGNFNIQAFKNNGISFTSEQPLAFAFKAVQLLRKEKENKDIYTIKLQNDKKLILKSSGKEEKLDPNLNYLKFEEDQNFLDI